MLSVNFIHFIPVLTELKWTKSKFIVIFNNKVVNAHLQEQYL